MRIARGPELMIRSLGRSSATPLSGSAQRNQSIGLRSRTAWTESSSPSSITNTLGAATPGDSAIPAANLTGAARELERVAAPAAAGAAQLRAEACVREPFGEARSRLLAPDPERTARRERAARLGERRSAPERIAVL